jgi:hypothetical protein
VYRPLFFFFMVFFPYLIVNALNCGSSERFYFARRNGLRNCDYINGGKRRNEELLSV